MGKGVSLAERVAIEVTTFSKVGVAVGSSVGVSEGTKVGLGVLVGMVVEVWLAMVVGEEAIVGVIGRRAKRVAGGVEMPALSESPTTSSADRTKAKITVPTKTANKTNPTKLIPSSSIFLDGYFIILNSEKLPKVKVFVILEIATLL